MRSTALSEKYARALFECTFEANKTKESIQFLQSIKAAFESAPELAAFASSPVIKPADKKAAMLAATTELKFDSLYSNFIVLLAENDRLYLISEILDSYQSQLDDKNGITRGEARSSHELSASEKEEITNVISKLTNKKVILDYKVEPQLIGSLVAQVGSLTIDDSLKTHLNRLEDDLNRRVH